MMETISNPTVIMESFMCKVNPTNSTRITLADVPAFVMNKTGYGRPGKPASCWIPSIISPANESRRRLSLRIKTRPRSESIKTEPCTIPSNNGIVKQRIAIFSPREVGSKVDGHSVKLPRVVGILMKDKSISTSVDKFSRKKWELSNNQLLSRPTTPQSNHNSKPSQSTACNDPVMGDPLSYVKVERKWSIVKNDSKLTPGSTKIGIRMSGYFKRI